MAAYNYTPAPKASLLKGRFGGIVSIREAATAIDDSSSAANFSCKRLCKPAHSLLKGRFGGIVDTETKRFEIGRRFSAGECLTSQN